MKYISDLGGREAHDGIFNNEVTMLVSKGLVRSEKLLCCIAAGKPICHPSYIMESMKQSKFLPIVSHFA